MRFLGNLSKREMFVAACLLGNDNVSGAKGIGIGWIKRFFANLSTSKRALIRENDTEFRAAVKRNAPPSAKKDIDRLWTDMLKFEQNFRLKPGMVKPLSEAEVLDPPTQSPMMFFECEEG